MQPTEQARLADAPSTQAPEELPVEPIEDSPSTEAGSMKQRLVYALGPVLGALLLDTTDFATMGPLGLFVGGPLGAAIGWWLAGMYRLDRFARVALAALAGAYCMAPFTNFMPIATVLTALARFLEDPPRNPAGNRGTPSSEDES